MSALNFDRESSSESLNDAFGVACYHKLLIRRDKEYLNAGIGSGKLYDIGLMMSLCVLLGVYLNTEEFHVCAYALAQLGVVLAHAGCEHNGIKTVHCRCIGADELLNLICHNGGSFYGICAVLVVLADRLLEVAGVGGVTVSYAEEAALLIHVVVHLIGSEPLILHNEGDDSRVDGAAACAHLYAVKRRKAHARVDALAALNCGNGCAVSDMAGDYLGVLCWLAEQLYHLL